MNREDLKNYKYTEKWVKEQLDKYEEMKERAYNLSQNFDGMPKAKNKVNYALEELIDQYNELIKVINKDQEKLTQIIKQMDQLKPLHKLILYKRYINGEDLEQISTEVNYNYYRTCRINGEALEEFDKVGKKWQDIAK